MFYIFLPIVSQNIISEFKVLFKFTISLEFSNETKNRKYAKNILVIKKKVQNYLKIDTKNLSFFFYNLIIFLMSCKIFEDFEILA
jgi:hypothetical protein